MRIACNRCQTRYDIPDEKLGQGAVKVRCSECGHMFLVRKKAAAAREIEPHSPEEASFDDFEFGDFGQEADGGSAALGQTPIPGDDVSPVDQDELDEAMPSLGELDLGDFESLDEGFGEVDEDLAGEEMLAHAEEPLERIREEELVPPVAAGDVEVQGLAEDMPRLDIQRGPRRPEGGIPSPLVARDRRRSPLFWVVLATAAGAAAYTGYNAYRHPEAFTLLKPSKVRALWKSRTAGAQLGVEELRGYYQDLPPTRRFFVIRGEVMNRSKGARSLIRVRGNLFGTDGKTLASREVYCGNVLTESELATLPADTIESRLQNEIGQTFSNVDIAPGSRVPFMVVFTSPPDGVEKFNVTVTEARAGSDS